MFGGIGWNDFFFLAFQSNDPIKSPELRPMGSNEIQGGGVWWNRMDNVGPEVGFTHSLHAPPPDWINFHIYIYIYIMCHIRKFINQNEITKKYLKY